MSKLDVHILIVRAFIITCIYIFVNRWGRELSWACTLMRDRTRLIERPATNKSVMQVKGAWQTY